MLKPPTDEAVDSATKTIILRANINGESEVGRKAAGGIRSYTLRTTAIEFSSHEDQSVIDVQSRLRMGAHDGRHV